MLKKTLINKQRKQIFMMKMILAMFIIIEKQNAEVIIRYVKANDNVPKDFGIPRRQRIC